MEPWQAGAIAGITSRCLTAPIDLLKIRLQINPHKQTIPTVFKNILQQEGITAFWKGNVPGIALYASFAAVQFWVIGKRPTGNKFMDGAMAASLAYTLTYPFDLLRTQFAIRGIRSPRLTITTPTDLLRGISPSLLQVAPYMGLVLQTEHLLHSSLHLPHYLSGFLAGAISKSLMMPLDVIKRRMQTQNLHMMSDYAVEVPKYPQGIISTARAIVRNEGVRALWSGWSMAVLKSAPATAITFCVYNLLL